MAPLFISASKSSTTSHVSASNSPGSSTMKRPANEQLQKAPHSDQISSPVAKRPRQDLALESMPLAAKGEVIYDILRELVT